MLFFFFPGVPLDDPTISTALGQRGRVDPLETEKEGQAAEFGLGTTGEAPESCGLHGNLDAKLIHNWRFVLHTS